MTEPVAYRVDGTIYNDIKDAEFAVRELEHLRSSLGVGNGLIRKPVIIESLYTYEQLPPRVKMTQGEFDELEKSLINAQFDYSELKKMIEIVPDMKWFVVAKQPSFNGKYSVVQNLDIENVYGIYRMYEYDRISYNAYKFDTKEEAELWTNPDTEAVQLPVEDK